MINKLLYILVIALLIPFLSLSQSKEMLNEYERSCISVFDDLKEAIQLKLAQVRLRTEKQRTDVINKRSSNAPNTDSADLRKLVDDYFLILYDNNIDSDTTSRGKVIVSEFNTFFSYFVGRDIQQITIQPLRILKDNSVYQKMSKFQKENSFGLLDKNVPDKIVAYLLFVPGKLIKTKTPRIMSWTLGYAFGVYYYEDMLGKKGMEFLFEGKSGPEKPIQGF